MRSDVLDTFYDAVKRRKVGPLVIHTVGTGQRRGLVPIQNEQREKILF